jgi:transitional endoplasmic reticulum ATPase
LQIHTRNMPLDRDVEQDRIAAVTHGFVGADLEYLCKEAAMKCLRRLLPELNLEDEKLSPEVLNKLIVTKSDFDNAVKEVTPSSMREVYLESPDIPWSAIGGLEDIKRELQEAVEWPLRFPELYTKLGHSMPKGLLLNGLSGTLISISLSNLPGLLRAGSIAFGRFVAAITITFPLASRPSMSDNN